MIGLKKNIKIMNYKELKEKKLIELKYTIEQYKKTIGDLLFYHKGENKDNVQLLEKEIVKFEKLIAFIEGMGEKEFEIYYSYPIDRIHNTFPDCSVDDDIECYEKIFKLCSDDETLYKNIKSCGDVSINEPARKNNYLVSLPEYFNISVSEVVAFSYAPEGQILITVRETLGKKQIKKIVDYLNSKRNGNPESYQEIKYIQLTPNLNVDYVHVFKDVSFNRYIEFDSTYNVKEDNLKYFQMEFSFKSQDILDDETTNKEDK